MVKHERNREYAQASLLTSLGKCMRLLEVLGPTVSCSLAREACGYSVELYVISQKFWFYFYHFHFALLLTHPHLSRTVVFKKITEKGVDYEREGWERLFENEGETLGTIKRTIKENDGKQVRLQYSIWPLCVRISQWSRGLCLNKLTAGPFPQSLALEYGSEKNKKLISDQYINTCWW